MGCHLNICATNPTLDSNAQIRIKEEINEINNVVQSFDNKEIQKALSEKKETLHENQKSLNNPSINKISSKSNSNIVNSKSDNAVKSENNMKIEENLPKENQENVAQKQNSKQIESLKNIPSKQLSGKSNSQKENTIIEAERKSTKKNTNDNFHLVVGPEIFVSLKKGSLSDNYETGKVLGEGAFGKVCLVTHKTTKMLRAMKSMKKSSLLKEEESKMFAEMNILKDLDHPNIVKLYELFQDDENYYLITEYCSGGELFDRIKSMSNFSEKIAADYLKQILSAVVYCHSKKIVHRDLKPENLIFDSTSSKATLKVIDFGTSRKFDGDTKMTKRLGTPYYIAPEVLSKNYNEKCDVWSSGIILYILLCGYPPFTGKSEEEILKKVKIGKFEFDPEDWSKVSHDAKDLINKMLTYDPNTRISAKDALNHSFIQKNSSNVPLNEKVLNNLGNFHQKTKLQAAIYTFIATQIMSQNEKAELQKTFQALDKDGDGRLSIEELIEGYTKIYGEGEREKVLKLSQSIINQVDQNYSGSIDFTEFLVAALNEDKLLNKKKIEQTFKMFDADGNGFITKEEIEGIMGGIPIDDTTWKAILDETDTNKDGKISMDEFVELLLRKFDE